MKKILVSLSTVTTVVVLCAVSVLSISCCSDKVDPYRRLTKGDQDNMDSLSYMLGLNNGIGMKYQYGNVLPLDIESIGNGFNDAALGKKVRRGNDAGYDEAVETLESYFSQKANERYMNLMQKRAEMDSVRLANGDSTVVKYGPADEMFENDDERQSVSYAFGYDLGHGMRDNANISIQTYWFTKGMTEGWEIDPENPDSEDVLLQANDYLRRYFTEIRSEELKEQSEKWLAEVEKKCGVKKTESGLLYRIDKKGNKNVKATDDNFTVYVRYEGSCANGYVFDSSYKRVEELKKQIAKVEKDETLSDEEKERRLTMLNQRLTESEKVELRLDGVIKGWAEGLKLIGKGGKITLWIPAELAYGESGTPNPFNPLSGIGPNEALRFDVELVDVKASAQPAQAE